MSRPLYSRSQSDLNLCFREACVAGDTAEATAALHAGADPYADLPLGETPLSLVVQTQDLSRLRFLLNLVPQTALARNHIMGQTPLMHVVASTQPPTPPVLQLLLDASDAHATSFNGWDALKHAIHAGNTEVAAALVPVSDLNSLDRAGNDVLMRLAMPRQRERSDSGAAGLAQAVLAAIYALPSDRHPAPERVVAAFDIAARSGLSLASCTDELALRAPAAQIIPLVERLSTDRLTPWVPSERLPQWVARFERYSIANALTPDAPSGLSGHGDERKDHAGSRRLRL